MCYVLGWFFPLSSLLVTMSIPDLHMLHWSVPRYSSLILLNRLRLVSQEDKNWMEILNKADAETLLSARKFLSCFWPVFDSSWSHAVELAVRESPSISRASTGESEQESPAKQSPFRRGLEQSNVNTEKCHQNPKVGDELNSPKECCFPEFLSNGSGSWASISPTKSSLA